MPKKKPNVKIDLNFQWLKVRTPWPELAPDVRDVVLSALIFMWYQQKDLVAKIVSGPRNLPELIERNNGLMAAIETAMDYLSTNGVNELEGMLGADLDAAKHPWDSVPQVRKEFIYGHLLHCRDDALAITESHRYYTLDVAAERYENVRDADEAAVVFLGYQYKDKIKEETKSGTWEIIRTAGEALTATFLTKDISVFATAWQPEPGSVTADAPEPETPAPTPKTPKGKKPKA